MTDEKEVVVVVINPLKLVSVVTLRLILKPFIKNIYKLCRGFIL